MSEAGEAARDLRGSGIIEVNGLILDNKLRLGGILFLEERYECKLQDVKLDTGRVREAVNLMMALAVQRNPNMTEQEIEAKIKGLDADELANLTDTLSGAIDVKNLPRPAPKKRSRKRVTKKA